MKPFEQLITEAQAALDAIASTEAFTEVLEYVWNCNFGLLEMREELDDLRNRYLKIQSSD